MKEIKYEKMSSENFNEFSLDKFVRHQEVKECWRNIDGEWKLIQNEFTEDWPLEKCRSIAKNISGNLNGTMIDYAAFDGNDVVGYITLGTDFFGSQKQYLELVEFQVSEPYRRQGIGRNLFKILCDKARELNAKKIYISAHSSKESQAAYRKLGCTYAEEINQINVENEPCDVQMEYVL